VTASMLFINEAETREILTPLACLEIVEKVFTWHAKDRIAWPTPRMWRMNNAEFSAKYHIKGCILPEIPVFGVRVVGYHVRPDGSGTSDPDNTRYIFLQDPTTGRPLALVDEHWNYALRTTASAMVACKYMARKDSQVIGLIGVGNMGLTSLLELKELYDIREVRVTSRRPETRQAFAEKMRAETGLNVIAVETAEETVRGADIVVTGTTANRNIVMPGWLKKGSFIATLAANELHDGVYLEADKIVVDDWEQNQALPDVKALIERNVLTRERVYAEIHEIVAGTKPARESDDEIVLVRTEGLVTQDVAVAHWVYEQAVARGMGRRME